MRIGARLLHSLWPEIGQLAVYLHNRTLNYSNNSTRWESSYIRFYQAIDYTRGLFNIKNTKKHPNQTYLVAYGCKAYAITANA
jgi:hypothetical protein